MENWIECRNRVQMILGILWVNSPTVDVEISDEVSLTIPTPRWARGLPNTETNIQSIAGSRYAMTWARGALDRYGGIQFALNKELEIKKLARRLAEGIVGS